LVDDFNQKLYYSGNQPNDNVNGYSMAELSRIVSKSYGLKSLKEEIKKAKPNGLTDIQIDLLFQKYEEVWE